MTRLAKVEMRKALDTRAGRWLVIGILGLVVVIEVIYAFAANDADKNLQDFIQIPGAVLGYFLPIIIIMLVTSEASQRNGLVTFTLEPRRSRMVVAKFLAGLPSRSAVMVLAFVLAVLGTLFGIVDRRRPVVVPRRQPGVQRVLPVHPDRHLRRLRPRDADHEHGGRDRRLLRLHPDPAHRRGLLSPLSRHLRGHRALDRVQHRTDAAVQGDYSPTGEEWAQIATSGTIWLIIPLALGIWRLMRIEFK